MNRVMTLWRTTLDRLVRIDTNNADIERRGRVTIVLLLGFAVLTLISVPPLLLLVEEGRVVIVAMTVGFMVSILGLVEIARRGMVDLCGVLSSMAMSLILFLGVWFGSEDAFEEVGWFFTVSILIACYAVRPRLILFITIANVVLLALLGVASHMRYGIDMGLMVSMQILVVMVAVSSWLFSRRTQEMFLRLFSLNDELDRARAEAVSASEAKSSFLAHMSHELRTPMNAILGYTELILDDYAFGDPPSDEDLCQDLERIQQAGNHLLSLINDVLDLSRLLSGRVDLDVQPFALDAMLEDVVSIVGPMVEDNRNTLRLEVEVLGEVVSDERKLRQIAFNLISNAIKFTKNGQIVVSARALDDDLLVIEVADTGIGITPEVQRRLFQAFERASNQSTIEGTGLGLALSRQFARLLGGDVTFESVHSQGSTFQVSFLRVLKRPDSTPSEASATTTDEAAAPADLAASVQ